MGATDVKSMLRESDAERQFTLSLNQDNIVMNDQQELDDRNQTKEAMAKETRKDPAAATIESPHMNIDETDEKKDSMEESRQHKKKKRSLAI